ncbi:hypothetical protein GPECTOR_34g773 [Gonium pectorale]|uniref:BTB domain-containing protein n=1 Tax=Gonium pectorale TaxID=33097 RepID=A0A150GCP8_GONPE|nr:hypothetical protein GPECTOR_34g773 [Gonium pectorale]|eukprot:KXZ47614.1 hypothetical protein GPECTOR_34g773 [Gonium pectorale]
MPVLQLDSRGAAEAPPRELSDLTLLCPDGRAIHCHSVILAAASRRFASVFKQAGWTPGQQMPVKGVDSDALETLVRAFYTSECPLDLDRIPAIYDAAVKLEVPSLAPSLEQFVSTALTAESALGFLQRCLGLGLGALADAALEWIRSRVAEVVPSPEFRSCQLDTAALVCKNLAQRSQLVGLQAAVSWLSALPSRAALLLPFAELTGLDPEAIHAVAASGATLNNVTAALGLTDGGAGGRQHGLPHGLTQSLVASLGLDLTGHGGSGGFGGPPLVPSLDLGMQPGGMGGSGGHGGGGGMGPLGTDQQSLLGLGGGLGLGLAPGGGPGDGGGGVVPVLQLLAPMGRDMRQQMLLMPPGVEGGAAVGLQSLLMQQHGAGGNDGKPGGKAGGVGLGMGFGLDALAEAAQDAEQAAARRGGKAGPGGGGGLGVERSGSAASTTSDMSGEGQNHARPLPGGGGRAAGAVGGGRRKRPASASDEDEDYEPGASGGGVGRGGGSRARTQAAYEQMAPSFDGMGGGGAAGAQDDMNSGGGGGSGGGGDAGGGGGALTESSPPVLMTGRRQPAVKGTCHVEGCGASLVGLRDYYQRYKICEFHLKVNSVLKGGVPHRFCQQCGRFQPVSEFDGEKRSCRVMLQRHCNRRAKQKQELAEVLAQRLGEKQLQYLTSLPADGPGSESDGGGGGGSGRSGGRAGGRGGSRSGLPPGLSSPPSKQALMEAVARQQALAQQQLLGLGLANEGTLAAVVSALAAANEAGGDGAGGRGALGGPLSGALGGALGLAGLTGGPKGGPSVELDKAVAEATAAAAAGPQPALGGGAVAALLALPAAGAGSGTDAVGSGGDAGGGVATKAE